MSKPLNGVRVIEVASWVFVPAAGAILADWGADVVKIEHPSRPDPQRALVVTEYGGPGKRWNAVLEQANRGKRSVGIDLATASGLSVLYQLVEQADVFLTNLLPTARRKLGIDVADVQKRNPQIVYAKGSGYGPRGPEADKPGFDGTAYLAHGGVAHALRDPESEWPVTGSGGQGDLPGAMTVAGGVAAALFERERTGRASVVDVSLLGTAMWSISPAIVAVDANGIGDTVRPRREENMNPLTIYYRTRDGRFIKLSMLQSDLFFTDLCEHLDVPTLATDKRFVDSEARTINRVACVEALDQAFGQFDLSELITRFKSLKGAWAVVQSPQDLLQDPQVLENGYLAEVSGSNSETIRVVAAPVQFDGSHVTGIQGCPAHGQHTDEVLMELGIPMDQLIELKIEGAIL
jgi:crotonobetainyl-CoA:carnitine CoA-transferase CaiB-like acyl-CoA transferase